MKISDLEFQSHPYMRGIHARHTFPNGYGISVVRTTASLGGRDGLYEVAVLKNNSICYDTPITNDILGYQTEEDINNIINKIEVLS